MASAFRVIRLLRLNAVIRVARTPTIARSLSCIAVSPTWQPTRVQCHRTSSASFSSLSPSSSFPSAEEIERNQRSVFVGGLEPDTEEELLNEYFTKFGEVENVRLMRTFLGYSRNYGFVLFRDHQTATDVLEQSHVINGKKVDVGRAKNYRVVYVGGLPSHFTEQTVQEHFSKFGEIESVKLIENTKIGAKTGYAFITYSTVEEAKKATEQEIQEILDSKVKVKARSQESGESLEAILAQSRKLMVGDLPFETTVDELKAYFEDFGELKGIDLLINSQMKTCAAIVFFRNLEDIQKVVTKSHVFADVPISVTQVPDQEKRGVREKTIFIDNLSEDLTEVDVLKYFRPYGQIAKVNLLRDTETQKSQGCGIVKFRNPRIIESILESQDHVIGQSRVKLRRRGLKIRSHLNTDELSHLNFELSLSDKH